MLRACILALLTGLFLVSASVSVAITVDAGVLRAEVQENPWRLSLLDESSRPVLVESAAGAAEAGPLGFGIGTGTAHATRVISSEREGETLTAIVETDDPAGRRMRVVVEPDGPGVIRLEARIDGDAGDLSGFSIGFEAAPNERFFGFGERSNAVDQRGNTVENYVADGPYQDEELEFVAIFVPRPGFRAREDATYFPVPWLLSSRGYGVLIDNAETSYFHLAKDGSDEWSTEVKGAPDGVAALRPPESLRMRFFAGPRPADALYRFTARVGRQPEPEAPWVLGPWFQPGGSLTDRMAQIGKLRAEDAPVSVAQTYTHYLPCGDHVNSRTAQQMQTSALHDAGLAVTTYFNPMICVSHEPRFSEAVAAGALAKNEAGEPYIYPYTGSTVFLVGQFDFTVPESRSYYHLLLGEAVDDGYDGWMEDFGEYTPLDARTADGKDGTEAHNLHPLHYHCAAYEFARRQSRPVIRFQRSGWTGVAPCAQVVWGGDPSTSWGFDGLASAVRQGINIGLSGIALWGSDIGGFFAFGGRELTDELLMRWVQFGAVSGVMRTQRNGFAIPARVRPQIEDDDQIANWRRWAKLRTQLYPYLQAAAFDYRRTGTPIMRHLLLAYPDDPSALARDDEYLFGPDLLAAPVIEPGATTRSLYLPAGKWIDLWRSADYDAESGRIVLRQPTILDGGVSAVLPAPLEELPLLVRAGAILPFLPPDVDTLADYGESAPDLVKLADREDELAILAFPRGRSEARFFRTGRLRSYERSRSWDLVIRGRHERRYVVQASLATLERPFIPCAVEWNGEPLAGETWSYNEGDSVLTAEVTGLRGRLSVRRQCTPNSGFRIPRQSPGIRGLESGIP